MGTSWPLVGRQVELDAAIGRCRAGGVLLSGPPGVGKTRLAAEVVEAVAPTRLVSVRATGVSSRMPLGAFAQVLAASGLGDVDAARLRAAASQLLGELADGERLVLSVDDVHLLDDTSATLLLHLAMSGRVDMVLTLRTGEPVPEPVTLLWRDELVTRIDLQPLADAAMAELLDLALPGGIDGRARTTLLTASGGNLLYLRELVHGMVESGTLDRSRGHWELVGTVTPPPRLAELVGLRLASLSEQARYLLDAVALGEPLGTHGVEEVGAWHLAQELLDAGMVELVEDGRRRQLRAVHPLHVEVARSSMSEPLRRGALDALADAVEAHGCRRRDDVRRLATWRLDAGRPADAVVLVDAAREALWGADSRMCERFARAALGDDALADDVRLAAVHLLGIALDDQGRFEEAEEVMAAHEPDAGTGSGRTMLALARSANLFRGLGRHDDALQVLKEADAAVTEAHLHDELLAERASFAVFSGRVQEALELAAPLLRRSDDRSFCQGALQASVASTLSGRNEVAIEIATEAFETRIRLGDQVQIAEPGIHLVALAMAQLDAGRIIDGYHTAVAAYEGAVSLGDRHGQAWLSVVLSRAELFLGRLQDALRHAREAALVFGALRHPGTRWGYGSLALASGQLGDADTAATAIEDLDSEPPTPLTLMDVDLERGRAWALVAAGRLTAARRALVPLAEQARGRGQFGMEVGVLHDLVRLGEPALAVDRLRALEELVDGELVQARSAHAAASCSEDGAALDAVAARFAAMGAELFAAEAATAAAAAHRRAGAARPAAAADQAAARWRSACQGAATPALAIASTSEELTRREREVAGLAAQGLSNREIADHLVVSVRTVENHLQRVYTKLGVGSREELRAVLG